MTLRLVTPPAAEPISLADAKLDLKVETTDDDVLIAAHIQAAREQAEHILGRSLMPQTWELLLDAFPADAIQLARSPVSAIVSVSYTDADGAEQTLDPADYTLDADNLPGWLLPAYGTSWPGTRDVINAVRVRFTAGYADAAAVPAGVRAWMLLRLRHLYRGETDWSPHFDRLLDAAKVYL